MGLREAIALTKQLGMALSDTADEAERLAAAARAIDVPKGRRKIDQPVGSGSMLPTISPRRPKDLQDIIVPSTGVPMGPASGGFPLGGMGDGRGLVLDAWGNIVRQAPAPVGLGGGGGGAGFGPGGSGPISAHPSGGGGGGGGGGNQTGPVFNGTPIPTDPNIPFNGTPVGGKAMLAVQTEQLRVLRDIRASVRSDGGVALRRQNLV